MSQEAFNWPLSETEFVGYLITQDEQSKGGRGDEPKEKRVFGRLAVGILLFRLIFVAPVQATSSNASGGGSYFVAGHTRVS